MTPRRSGRNLVVCIGILICAIALFMVMAALDKAGVMP